MSQTSDVLTAAVIETMRRTPDPRLREIMVSLASHIHAFVRETRLTEDEFRQATAILNTMGQMSDERHNEMVLMAGSLGVSSLVCLLNNGENGATETAQNLLGPFWRMHSPPTANGESIARSPVTGPPMAVSLAFEDRDGRPVAGAQVDVWQCSGDGLYENQDPEQADHNLRGKFISDAEGRVSFTSVKPIGYPIPTDGVVGALLKAQGRHAFRPAHVHVLAFKPGFKTLITQIYADGDPNLLSDPQFGVTPATTGQFQRHDAPDPDRANFTAPWFSLTHRLVMEPGEARLPKPPIR